MGGDEAELAAQATAAGGWNKHKQEDGTGLLQGESQSAAWQACWLLGSDLGAWLVLLAAWRHAGRWHFLSAHP